MHFDPVDHRRLKQLVRNEREMLHPEDLLASRAKRAAMIDHRTADRRSNRRGKRDHDIVTEAQQGLAGKRRLSPAY